MGQNKARRKTPKPSPIVPYWKTPISPEAAEKVIDHLKRRGEKRSSSFSGRTMESLLAVRDDVARLGIDWKTISPGEKAERLRKLQIYENLTEEELMQRIRDCAREGIVMPLVVESFVYHNWLRPTPWEIKQLFWEREREDKSKAPLPAKKCVPYQHTKITGEVAQKMISHLRGVLTLEEFERASEQLRSYALRGWTFDNALNNTFSDKDLVKELKDKFYTSEPL
jgi:hypothetical protein